MIARASHPAGCIAVEVELRIELGLEVNLVGRRLVASIHVELVEVVGTLEAKQAHHTHTIEMGS